MSISSMLIKECFIKETPWHNAWEWHHGSLQSTTAFSNRPAALGCQRWRPCKRWRPGSDCPGSKRPQFLLCRAPLQTPHLPLWRPCSLSWAASIPVNQNISIRSKQRGTIKNTKFTVLYVGVLLWNITLTSQILLVPWKIIFSAIPTVVQKELITPAEF